LTIVADVLLTHGKIATLGGGSGPKRGAEMNDVGWIDQGCIAIRDGIIVYVGTQESLRHVRMEAREVVDLDGRLVTPGWIDPHTHLVHAGSREHELEWKLRGMQYLEILAQGGGILETVRATRNASEDALYSQAHASIIRMLEHGTTTVEAKSGYGLERETELKQLRVARRLQQTGPVEVVSTFMGPHALPAEYRNDPDGFLMEMIGLLDPIREQGLAEFCDIFCEQGVFSIEQSRMFLQSAREKGFGLKLHADEIEPLGGAELAAELKTTSVEHILAASKEGLKRIGREGIIAVLLPGTSWNLGAKQHADARYLIDEANAAVALATDYNPGSCPTESLQLIMAFACNLLRMTPEEALTAVTRNAAYAVNRGERLGTLEVGKQADICAFHTDQLAYIPYHFGINHIYRVWKKGIEVVRDGVYVGHVERDHRSARVSVPGPIGSESVGLD
jgi:imidazolonepropionase